MSHAVNNQPITPSRGFDVFLSHNSREKAIIEGIAYRLRDKGIEPWLDKWYLVPGARWQGGLAEGLNLSASCAVFIGANNLGNWEWEELELAQDRAAKDKNFRLIPVLLPGLPEPFDPSILPPFLSTRMWVDFRRGVNDEEAFNLLVCAIRGVAPGPDDKNNLIQRPGGPGNDLCPYRGLQTFDETDADLFFGREGEIQRLIEKLKAARFLAVIGPSGSGKSSLVRAGLIPRLRRGDYPAAPPGRSTFSHPAGALHKL